MCRWLVYKCEVPSCNKKAQGEREYCRGEADQCPQPTTWLVRHVPGWRCERHTRPPEGESAGHSLSKRRFSASSSTSTMPTAVKRSRGGGMQEHGRRSRPHAATSGNDSAMMAEEPVMEAASTLQDQPVTTGTVTDQLSAVDLAQEGTAATAAGVPRYKPWAGEGETCPDCGKSFKTGVPKYADFQCISIFDHSIHSRQESQKR